MKIGKFTLDKIMSVVFDQKNLVIGGWLVFLGFVISQLNNIVVNAIASANFRSPWISVSNGLSAVLLVVISTYFLLVLTNQIKAGLASGKAKKSTPVNRALFWKTLGIVVIYICALLVVGFALFGFGQIVNFPFGGTFIVALLAVPAAILLAYVTVFLLVTGKLLIAATIENKDKALLTISKKLLAITMQKPQQILFNFLLTLLPALVLVIALAAVAFIIYLGYLFFAWYLPGMSTLLNIFIQSESGPIYFILKISTGIIAAYLLSYLVVLFSATAYSVYLDAVESID